MSLFRSIASLVKPSHYACPMNARVRSSTISCHSSGRVAKNSLFARPISALFHSSAISCDNTPRTPIEHCFLRFDAYEGTFENKITVSLPDTTPDYVVAGTQAALAHGLKDRPDCRDYSLRSLPVPQFTQSGAEWGRFMYTLTQREVEGAVDPYTLQTIILDHLVNVLGGTVVSSTSSYSKRMTETNIYILSFKHESPESRSYYRKRVEEED